MTAFGICIALGISMLCALFLWCACSVGAAADDCWLHLRRGAGVIDRRALILGALAAPVVAKVASAEALVSIPAPLAPALVYDPLPVALVQYGNLVRIMEHWTEHPSLAGFLADQ